MGGCIPAESVEYAAVKPVLDDALVMVDVVEDIVVVCTKKLVGIRLFERYGISTYAFEQVRRRECGMTYLFSSLHQRTCSSQRIIRQLSSSQ